MTKITYWNCEVLYESLNVVGNSKWAKETRELTMQKVIVIMEQMTDL